MRAVLTVIACAIATSGCATLPEEKKIEAFGAATKAASAALSDTIAIKRKIATTGFEEGLIHGGIHSG